MSTCCRLVVQHFVQQIDSRSQLVECEPHWAPICVRGCRRWLQWWDALTPRWCRSRHGLNAVRTASRRPSAASMQTSSGAFDASTASGSATTPTVPSVSPSYYLINSLRPPAVNDDKVKLQWMKFELAVNFSNLAIVNFH